jgi:hypothetical protein
MHHNDESKNGKKVNQPSAQSVQAELNALLSEVEEKLRAEGMPGLGLKGSPQSSPASPAPHDPPASRIEAAPDAPDIDKDHAARVMTNPAAFMEHFREIIRQGATPSNPFDAMFRRMARVKVPQGHTAEFYLAYFSGFMGVINIFHKMPEPVAFMLAVSIAGAIAEMYTELVAQASGSDDESTNMGRAA